MSTTGTTNSPSAHIGQFRVSFEYDTCGPATIIAQQVQNEEGQVTFRKWNPEKVKVSYGQSTDADSGATQGNLACCYICVLVDCCCSAVFEEVVDHAVDTHITSTQYFDSQQDNIKMAAKIVRPSGIALQILGLFLLFSPVIAILSWIPLVGWLLGGAVALAAFVFSLVVGFVLSCLTIALAWLVYRPLIGVLFLALVCGGIALIFFIPEGEETVDGEASQSDSITTVAA